MEDGRQRLVLFHAVPVRDGRDSLVVLRLGHRSDSGSGRESVRPPDLMGILILGNSGYTRQYEGDGLEQSTWVAGVSGLPGRNR